MRWTISNFHILIWFCLLLIGACDKNPLGELDEVDEEFCAGSRDKNGDCTKGGRKPSLSLADLPLAIPGGIILEVGFEQIKMISAALFYSIDSGATWIKITDLTKGQSSYNWNVPSINCCWNLYAYGLVQRCKQ